MILGVQLQENRGDIAAAGFLAFAVMLLVHARGALGERKPSQGHGAKCRAKRSSDDGRGQALAGYVCYHHDLAPIREIDYVNIVTAYLITGAGADSDRVARNFREL